MDFRTFLQQNIAVFDGAFGTMVQKSGARVGTVPEEINLTQPQLAADIHRAYAAAGADVITADTFGANEKKAGSAKRAEELIEAGVRLAKEAAPGKFIALDIGPIGMLLEPMGTLSFEEAYQIFARTVEAGARAGADLVLIETMADLQELRAALLAAREHSDLPVLCSMTFEENGRTFAGCDPACYALAASPLADAVGVNCSLGPRKLLPIVQKILDYTDKPVLVQANAGLPDADMHYDVSAEEFAGVYAEFLRMGVRIVGGCCGTTPEYIRKLRALADTAKPFAPAGKLAGRSLVCSARRMAEVDGCRVIGERINPTGKKAMKAALLAGDYGYAQAQAVEQEEAGADILDVNAGLPEIDEKQALCKLVQAVQAVSDLPIQIDCGKADAIEAALRVYAGKAIVNSVNGEDRVLNSILPVVKKYGAAVVGLTMDEHGIPKTAHRRKDHPHLRILRHPAGGYLHRLPHPDGERRTGAGARDAGGAAADQAKIPRAHGAGGEQHLLRAAQQADRQHIVSDGGAVRGAGRAHFEPQRPRKHAGGGGLPRPQRAGQELRRLRRPLRGAHH